MTVTILRPSADVQNKFISESTAGPAWSLLDDAPDDDSTYVVVPAGHQYPESYLWMLLTDLAPLPASQRIKAVRIRARIRMNSSDPGHGAVIQARLWDDNREVPHSSVDAFTSTNPVSYTTRVGGWRTGPAASLGSEWTRDLVNRAYIHLSWHYSIGAIHENLRLSEVFVDVDIRDQATVTAVTVANAATSTRPTVTWTFNANADFDPQIAYRVKVFSSVQYGATGFDPETSKPIWDSLSRAGPGESIIVGRDLAIGSTFRAYVKGAADFNGLLWFSAWTASSPFTIQPTPLATPTFTVAADPSLPWLRNTLTLQGFLNALSAQQASLEDTTTAGWLAGASTAIANTASGSPPHGSRALQLTRQTTTGTAFANTPDPSLGQGAGIPVRGGVTFTARVEFRSAATPRSARVAISYFRADNSFISFNGGGFVTTTTSGWTVASVTAAAPVDATQALVALEVGNGAAVAGEVHYADKIQLVPGTSTTWAVGGMVGSGYLLVERAWATVAPENLASPQLWGGGDDLTTADGFLTTQTSLVAYDTSDRLHGQGSIRWDVQHASSNLYIGWPSGVFDDPDPDFALAAVPGRTYVLSLYAKASQSFSSNLTLQAIDKDGTAVGASSGGAITVGTGWQRFERTLTVPAGAVYVRPQLNNTGGVVGVTVRVDAVQWEQGTAATPLAVPGGRPLEWVPVRDADEGELLIPAGSQAVTLHDHEVPPGYTVLYRAQTIGVDPVSTLTISSNVSAYQSAILDPPGQGNWVLGIVTAPLYRTAVKVLGPLEESIHEESTKFFPVRPPSNEDYRQRPVIVSDFVGGRDGTLKLTTTSEDEFLLLERILAYPGTLWFVAADFGARYIRIDGDRSWSRRSAPASECPPGTRRWIRELTASFVETTRPR